MLYYMYLQIIFGFTIQLYDETLSVYLNGSKLSWGDKTWENLMKALVILAVNLNLSIFIYNVLKRLLLNRNLHLDIALSNMCNSVFNSHPDKKLRQKELVKHQKNFLNFLKKSSS